jgi:hypothetical protein
MKIDILHFPQEFYTLGGDMFFCLSHTSHREDDASNQILPPPPPSIMISCTYPGLGGWQVLSILSSPEKAMEFLHLTRAEKITFNQMKLHLFYL